MQADDKHRAAVKRAVLRLSRSLFRLMLDVNLGVGEYIAIAKLAAVQAVRIAEGEANRPPPTISRIAVLTGLSRPEVRRLLGQREDHLVVTASRHLRSRADRVLAAWKSDPAFLDEFNKPARLTVRGGAEPSFGTLVRKHSGTERVAPILAELLTTESVRKTDDGWLELVKDTCVNVHWDIASIGTLVSDLGRHFDTALHNLHKPEQPPKFARSYESEPLDPKHVPYLMRLFEDRAKLLIETSDETVSRKKYVSKSKKTEARRIALAIQIVDEPVPASLSSLKTRVKQKKTTRSKGSGVGAS